ncbi:glycosyltransferase family 2 protein [Kitasatospora sp. NPDC001540]|uniref:glycosyltransferase family 2 protein n=1 Tax=Kitasatospora sp. NPDC001540 TaxID=3364014 RepID=UPI0036CD9917
MNASRPTNLREVAALGSAHERWAESGYAPLELLVQVTVSGRQVRIPAPGGAGWTCESGDTWRRRHALALRALLADHTAGPASARLLLVRRGTPQVLAVLAETEVEQPWNAAGWLGWPAAGADAAIQTALGARSNDYWALDLAGTALGHGPLDTATSPALPWLGGVSVVLPARGVHDVLPEVVEALVAAAAQLTPDTPWEALVVDDASDPPLELPASLPPQIRLVRSERQLHCGGARNHGAERARYSLIVFCDADTLLAPNYLTEHLARHVLSPNLITVSLRDHVPAERPVPDRAPDGSRDSRVRAHYAPGRLGLVPVHEAVTVSPLVQTRNLRDFGHGRLLGPVDLPFMVKGNNLAVPARTARSVRFPPDFTGWGPEDVCFAAKAIAQGSYVVPVLSTGVFHREHPPRSGSAERRDAELTANLQRYARRLSEPAQGPWQETGAVEADR